MRPSRGGEARKYDQAEARPRPTSAAIALHWPPYEGCPDVSIVTDVRVMVKLPDYAAIACKHIRVLVGLFVCMFACLLNINISTHNNTSIICGKYTPFIDEWSRQIAPVQKVYMQRMPLY